MKLTVSLDCTGYFKKEKIDKGYQSIGFIYEEITEEGFYKGKWVIENHPIIEFESIEDVITFLRKWDAYLDKDDITIRTGYAEM